MHFLAQEGDNSNFVELDVDVWQWGVLLGFIALLLLVDILVIHRKAHAVKIREAAIESTVWISIGVAFSLVILWWFGGKATGEYMSGYLIEKSLSIDNVFVWALILSYFKVPSKYQHRVLFWGIFGALVMRAIFIYAGISLIEAFEWVLYIFGGFLLFTAGRLLFGGDTHVDPEKSKFLRLIQRFVKTSDELDGQKLFTIKNGQRMATPLFAVLLLIEGTDVVFAVDSVPAVLAVSNEPFIVFASNAFAILGLRALYFLLADMHGRFKYLQTGLAFVLAFVGVKMIIAAGWDYHIPTPLSLGVIATVLTVAIVASLRADGGEDETVEDVVDDEFEGFPDAADRSDADEADDSATPAPAESRPADRR
ncbi:MAG: TerC family protein [Actinomycetota bacterium]|nr:TerC family protein [Actinomycetota bacterium]